VVLTVHGIKRNVRKSECKIDTDAFNVPMPTMCLIQNNSDTTLFPEGQSFLLRHHCLTEGQHTSCSKNIFDFFLVIYFSAARTSVRLILQIIRPSKLRTRELLIITWNIQHSSNLSTIFWKFTIGTRGHPVAQLFEALSYKPEGRGRHWNLPSSCANCLEIQKSQPSGNPQGL
jgi:hypothetical protein